MMPRSSTGRKRKQPVASDMEAAANEVILHKLPLRKAAELFGVSRSTLSRHIMKHTASKSDAFKYEASNATHLVFTREQEEELLSYILKAGQWNYGVTVTDLKQLAFQFAKANKIKYPDTWDKEEAAGRQWYRNFRKRYNDKISLRKPEATSLGRMASFNKPNVEIFFQKLQEVYARYNLLPQNVWNVDETGCSTVHAPSRIIADKKAKQIGAATSGERGPNVTMIACVSAAGTFIPPALIFPRVHFKEYMTNNAPPGTIGMANLSGWSNAEIFVNFLEHFISLVKPSIGKEVLLVMDNHESHLSLDALNLCKMNGVVVLTFPPHTSHKLQPLDRSVFGPFKTYYNKACKDWMLTNPGKPISIYEVSTIVGKAFPLAFTPGNITSGFRVTGIWPFDSDVFGEDEFLPSEVTNRPYKEPTSDSAEINPENHSSITSLEKEILKTPSTSAISGESSHVTPEDIRPFPKAPPRKNSARGRKPGKCMIATDTPEKNRLEEQKLKTTCKPAPKRNPRKILTSSSSDDEEQLGLPSSLGGSNFFSSLLTGIYQYNPGVFDEADFAPSFVTDLENPVLPGDAAEINKPGESGPDVERAEGKDGTVSEEIRLPITPGTSTIDNPQPSTSYVSPEEIRPFPKAGERKCKGGRKKLKSMILTETPTKQRLELEKGEREAKKKNVKHLKKKLFPKEKIKAVAKGKNLKTSRKSSRKSIDEEDEDNTICVVCTEDFTSSRPGEGWIQCWTCKQWAHEACTPGEAIYTCHHCESDDPPDDE